jgi:hypothetical protein
VPKATEKKAVCGLNQAFNNVTRSCYSIEEVRTKPVGTMSTGTLFEEVAKTLTLSYSDLNKNLALTCKVTALSDNIEAVSPQVLSGNIFTKATLVFNAADSAANSLAAGAAKTSALLERDAMSASLALARSSFNYTIITTQLGLMRAAATNLLTIVSAFTSDATTNAYYKTAQNNLITYDAAKVFVDNRCDCSGGVCTTSIAPRIHQNVAGGFTYTITDIDGEGAPKAVNLTITPLSMATTDYLKPAAESTYLLGAESATNTPGNYPFTLGTARDYAGTTLFTYNHNKTVKSGYFPSLMTTQTYVDSDNSLGKITNCMGLGGSLTSDTTCLFIPNDGDAFSILVPAYASVLLNADLTIGAKAQGAVGNTISIIFKSLAADVTSLDGSHSTTAEKYGLVGVLNDVYIRVINSTIYVIFNDNVTTTAEIADALNNDSVAKTLVTASAVATTTKALVASAATATSLAGGVSGFDTFTFTVSNGSSTNVATSLVTIQIDSTLDNPMWKPYPSTASALTAIDGTATLNLEASATLSMPINVSTTYYDPDDVATTCVVSTDPLDLILWTSGTYGLAGVTVAEVLAANSHFAQVMPFPVCTISGVAPNKIVTFSVDRGDATKQNVSGNYALLFKITNGATLTTNSPTYNAYRFIVTPVNDPPGILTYTWSTTSAIAPLTAGGTNTPMVVNENSTASPSSSYVDVTISPDVPTYGFENAQTLTISATSSDQTILKDANIIITSVSATVKRISFVTEKNQSSLVPINLTVTLVDSGGTANGGSNTSSTALSLTVTPVDDPPSLFSSATTVDTNEGGFVVSPGFQIEEDVGKSASEDGQAITITAFSSDNTIVLPNSAITMFYDLNDNGVEDNDIVTPANDETRTTGTPLEVLAGDDSGLHKLYFKLSPVAGVAGNANITITMSDGTTTATSVFSLIVHPIASLHGGWSNISSVGIKTDKSGAPVSNSDIQCKYNKSTDRDNCKTDTDVAGTKKDCTGTNSPHGSIVPSAVNALYWDSGYKRCYRSQSTSKFSWVDVTTSCPVTRISVNPTTLTTGINSAIATMTVASTTGFPMVGTITIGSEKISYTGKTITTFTGLGRGASGSTAAAHVAGDAIAYTANGDNFIRDVNDGAQGVPTATAKDQYYLTVNEVTHVKSCYASTEPNPGAWTWSATTYIPARVKLSWNSFTVAGAGADSAVQVYGWNVYRREAGYDYDYVLGYLKVNATDTMTLSDASARTFTDTTAVAGKVYYYLVRPVDSTTRHLSISTPEIFSEVRVLAPQENYSFVHRWMVNQEVCMNMHMTTSTTPNKVDPSNNYRCPYKGPGETAGYYDIGHDMLVDVSENGCPYTPAPACTADGCIGIGAPGFAASQYDVYYDRGSGICYINDGGWVNYNAANATQILNASTKVGSALNPPLVNVTQAQAAAVCANRSNTTATTGLTGAINGGVHSLPSKKDYIAFAASPTGYSDPALTDIEQGYSLNVTSRCNGTNANGLEFAFNDSNIPSTAFIYSLPGTASSSIRSIYTGSVPWVNSASTETCSSRYGIQDVYGNVAEWMTDAMTCSGVLNNFTCTASGATDLFTYDFGGGVKYGFDYLTGPYDDANGDTLLNAGDAFLTNWDFRDELKGAGKFSFPLGMPINVDLATANANQLAASPSLPYLLDIGPTSGITTNQLHEDGIIVNGVANLNGRFAQGGSYLSGNRAGRYSSELISNALFRSDVGLRCIIPVDDNANFPADARHTYPY